MLVHLKKFFYALVVKSSKHFFSFNWSYAEISTNQRGL